MQELTLNSSLVADTCTERIQCNVIKFSSQGELFKLLDFVGVLQNSNYINSVSEISVRSHVNILLF